MPQPPPAPALDVIIVGPGRLGRTATRRLRERGHRVRLVGRGEPIPAGPLTWLTVPDRAIPAAAAAVPPGGVRLHASGACGLSVLGPGPGRGSLHPLMTFPGVEQAPLHDGMVVPAAVAGDPAGLAGATALAQALGFTPFPVPGDRRAYHAAAVIAGNFATTLLGLASRVLASAGVPADEAPALLAPLALQSLHNAVRVGPAAALTGPIVRGDDAVVADHIAVLAAQCPEVLPVYGPLAAATRALVHGGAAPPVAAGDAAAPAGPAPGSPAAPTPPPTRRK